MPAARKVPRHWKLCLLAPKCQQLVKCRGTVSLACWQISVSSSWSAHALKAWHAGTQVPTARKVPMHWKLGMLAPKCQQLVKLCRLITYNALVLKPYCFLVVFCDNFVKHVCSMIFDVLSYSESNIWWESSALLKTICKHVSLQTYVPQIGFLSLHTLGKEQA